MMLVSRSCEILFIGNDISFVPDESSDPVISSNIWQGKYG